MAKVPLIPDWMREEFEEPEGDEPLLGPGERVPTEEDWILIAGALADEWNGRLISLEDVERSLRARESRERRQRLKAARMAAKPEADG